MNTFRLRAGVVGCLCISIVFMVIAPGHARQEAASDLVAAYHFNEGSGTILTDVSGQANHGAVSGAEWSASGRFGGALAFDGIDDIVRVAGSSSLNLTTAMTLEAWVKPTAASLSGWRTVLLKQATGNPAYALYGNQNVKKPGVEITLTAKPIKNVASGTAVLSTTTWTHIAATYDGATLRFYVNGTQASSRAAGGTIVVANGVLSIGGNDTWGEWFGGSIDELRIYSRRLSAAEIQADMNTPVGPPDTVTPNVAVTSPAAGAMVFGSVLLTATATDDVEVADVQFLLDGIVLGAPDTTSPYAITWNTASTADGLHTLSARARDSSGNTATSPAVSVAVSNIDTVAPTAPVNLVAQGSRGTISLAWGASSDNSGSVVYNVYRSPTPDVEATPANWIARAPAPSYVDEGVAAATYYYVVIAQDPTGNISQPSNEASATALADTTKPTVSLIAPSHEAAVSGTVPVTAIADDDSGIAGVQFFLDGATLGTEVTAAPYVFAWNTGLIANGPHTLTARARDLSGNTVMSAAITVTVANTAPTGLVAAYSFNEGAGGTVQDASGNGHIGTVSGATWLAAGVYGGALSFDGVNDLVTVADSPSLDLTAGMTLEAWVKPTAGTLSGWRTILLKEGVKSLAYALYGSQKVQWPGVEISAGATYLASGTQALPTTGWAHIAGTYDGAMLRFYVNGTQVSSTAATGSMVVTNGALRIGGNAIWGEWFNGLIDEVRIYSRALTAAEVEADMNRAVAPDALPPVVALTEPANGSTVKGLVTVAASAVDNVKIVDVSFYANGNPIGQPDLSAPYSITWDTSSLPAGSYTVTATARDTGGNTTTSSPVTVSINPDFSFTLLNARRQVSTTGRTQYDVEVQYLSGFTSSSVDLWFTGAPVEVSGTYAFDPMAHQGRTTLTIETINAPPGTYAFTMGATAEGITHFETATLVITDDVDFQVGTAPSSQNTNITGSAVYTINVTETNDFMEPVTLAVAGLPPGMTVAFSAAAVIPPASALLTITTSASTTPGTYELTVTGTSGALVRSVPVTLTVSSTTAVWSLTTLGSTGELNNTVRVGALRTDGNERVYVGTIETGRVLEYEWNGAEWSGPAQVAVSEFGSEIHDMTIGPGRGDGKERLYAASHDGRIYEIWHDSTGWHQATVGVLDGMAMHAAVGSGRNDGIPRLYAVSTRTLFEFTWNGDSWTPLTLGSVPGAHGVVVGKARGDGKNYVYVASISTGTHEARFASGTWTVASMGDSGDARNLSLGIGRNDSIVRVYSALFDGRVRELSWNGSGWSVDHLPDVAGAQQIHTYVVPGRNDDVNRVYTSSGDGKAYEYSWNGTSWTVTELGGGGQYLYGMHFGEGRNDGLLRLYGADRGTLNRVYEFTWK